MLLSSWSWSPSQPGSCYCRHKALELLLCLWIKMMHYYNNAPLRWSCFCAKFRSLSPQEQPCLSRWLMSSLSIWCRVISEKTIQGFSALRSIPLSARPPGCKGLFSLSFFLHSVNNTIKPCFRTAGCKDGSDCRVTSEQQGCKLVAFKVTVTGFNHAHWKKNESPKSVKKTGDKWK